MDLGVGSFVFSLGLISAYPMLRSPSQRFKPMRYQLLRDARRSLPLLALGSIRVIMVKGVDYPVSMGSDATDIHRRRAQRLA